MTASQRPLDSGRKDSLGRTIRTGTGNTESRSDAPPPFADPPPSRRPKLQQPKHPNPNAGIGYIGQHVQDADMLATAKSMSLEPGESLAVTVDENNDHTGGTAVVDSLYGDTLDEQITNSGLDAHRVKIITAHDDGYTMHHWPREPDNLTVDDEEGSWQANDGTTFSGPFATRDSAIDQYHRNRDRALRNNTIEKHTELVQQTLNGEFANHPDPELAGFVGVSCVGNVSPGGSNDGRYWSMSAYDWCDPKHVYPSNPIQVSLGSTDDIVRLRPDVIEEHVAALKAKLESGLSEGRYRRRR